MSGVSPGDPGSLSACGGLARRAAAGLGRDADLLRDAYAALGHGWTGLAARSTRASGGLVARTVADTAAELDRVGSLVQDHATTVATLATQVRDIEERAAAGGLEIRDGRLVPSWGISGEASQSRVTLRSQRRAELQARLDSTLAAQTRARATLRSALETSGGVLARLSAALRAG